MRSDQMFKVALVFFVILPPSYPMGYFCCSFFCLFVYLSGMDQRGMTWQKASCTPPNGTLVQALLAVRPASPPWASKYPYLKDLLNTYPCVPVFNVIANNTYHAVTTFLDASPQDVSAWHSQAYNNRQV